MEEIQSEVSDTDSSYQQSLMHYRSELLTIAKESQGHYDKAISTICSGALVATLGFFDKLPPETPKIGIVIAWILWSLGLITITISFHGSVRSSESTLARLDKHINRGNKRLFKHQLSVWHRITACSNLISLLLLIFGTVVFSASIAWGVWSMENTRHEYRQDTTKRYERIHTAPAAAQAGDRSSPADAPSKTTKEITRDPSPSD